MARTYLPSAAAPPGRRQQVRRGYTLRELLVTILFLLLVASVLVPWLGRARPDTPPVPCPSRLKQIAYALKLYKQDNHHYPLDAAELPPTRYWYGSDKTHGDGVGLAALFPDYMNAFKAYKCPQSDPTKPDDPGYCTYNVEDPAKTGADRLPYRRVWKLANGKQDPAERRQLIRPDAPGDTVVTWCRFHRRHPDSPSLSGSDQDLVVFVDAHVDLVPSAQTGHGYRPEPEAP